MPSKDKKHNYDEVLADVAPRTGNGEQKPQRTKQVNFRTDPDSKKKLERAVFWKGGDVTQDDLINQALVLLFATDPDTDRPKPNEK